MLQAVIFDMDGTLLDSVDLHAQAWVEALQHFGKKVSFEEVRQQIGKGGDQFLPVFLSPEEQERFGKDLEKFRGDLFKKKYLSQAKPFPQVRALCERFKQDGIRVGLGTSAKADELETYKKMVHIEDLVEEEATSDDAAQSKPHPDIFAASLKKLGNLSPAKALAVGDSPYDAESAGKLGLRSIGVLSGGFPQADLERAGYVRVFIDVADILKHYHEVIELVP